MIFVLFWICVQPGSLRLKINVLNTSAFCPLVRGKTNTNCHGRTTFFFNHFMILLCQFKCVHSPNTFNLTVDDYVLNISMNYWDTYRQTESEELRCIALIKLQILITSN